MSHPAHIVAEQNSFAAHCVCSRHETSSSVAPLRLASQVSGASAPVSLCATARVKISVKTSLQRSLRCHLCSTSAVIGGVAAVSDKLLKGRNTLCSKNRIPAIADGRDGRRGTTATHTRRRTLAHHRSTPKDTNMASPSWCYDPYKHFDATKHFHETKRHGLAIVPQHVEQERAASHTPTA
jgi:hypothetical protein